MGRQEDSLGTTACTAELTSVCHRATPQEIAEWAVAVAQMAMACVQWQEVPAVRRSGTSQAQPR